MKHKIWVNHFIGAAFAWLLSVSTIGCLITGFDLPVDSLLKIVLWCALFALISSMLLRFRYGGSVIVVMSAFKLYLLIRKEILWEQIQYLSYMISSHYHLVYNWPILGSEAAKEVTMPLLFWSALTAVAVNLHLCRRKHILIAFLPAVIPLTLCLVTTDRVPDAIYLYLLILGLALLLISDWTRMKHPAQGMKLVLRAALPIAVFLALLFGLNPQDKYVNNAGQFQKEVVSWFEKLQDRAEEGFSSAPVGSLDLEKLNLRTVGPKSNLSYSVMRVNSPISGTLYLRGRDYDRYTGTGWEASEDRKEAFTSGSASTGELTIVTYGVRNVLYVPYYAIEAISLAGGACENDENLQRYSYYLSRANSGDSGTPDFRYTKLPDSTHQWARELAAEIADGATSQGEIVRAIGDYVRNSAVYALSTARMASENSDFARWFLEESETGYCVHFATAATVLLRAAGIPARYVEGYMVSCTEGSNQVVSSQDAHAWAEYYDSDSCAWRVLEATPADPDEEEIEPSTAIPETEPPETEESVTESEATSDNNTNQNSIPEKPEDSTEIPVEQDVEKEPYKAPVWMKTVFLWLLIIACIPLQSYARIYRKRILRNRGSPNEQVIERWIQTQSLAKLLKEPYPEELHNLAQKAKFSQHKMKPEELQEFEDYQRQLSKQIQGQSWYQRIIFKWISAVE